MELLCCQRHVAGTTLWGKLRRSSIIFHNISIIPSWLQPFQPYNGRFTRSFRFQVLTGEAFCKASNFFASNLVSKRTSGGWNHQKWKQVRCAWNGKNMQKWAAAVSGKWAATAQEMYKTTQAWKVLQGAEAQWPSSVNLESLKPQNWKEHSGMALFEDLLRT